jgi:ATP-dependent helicase/nuclease subunit A
VRANAPALVDLWPMIEPDEKRELEGLGRAVRRDAGDKPARAARTPHRRHQDWIDRRGRSARARTVRPGDILVLVRQRGALFEAIIRAQGRGNVESRAPTG